MSKPKRHFKNAAAKYMRMSLRNFQRLVQEKVLAGYQQQYDVGKTGQRQVFYYESTLDEWKREREEHRAALVQIMRAGGNSQSHALVPGVKSPALMRLM